MTEKLLTKWTDDDSVTRDFKSLEHMNDTLVNRINETVSENDILIHLGDFSFGGFENIQLQDSRGALLQSIEVNDVRYVFFLLLLPWCVTPLRKVYLF